MDAGSYLSYNKGQGDGVVLLNKGIGAISMPGVWQVREKGYQIIALKAISIPGCCAPKIGYSSRCSSTDVKLNRGVDLNTLWRLIPVNKTTDTYHLFPEQLSGCTSVSYVLGIEPRNGGTGSSSSCRHSVSLVQQNTVPSMIWKFTRAKASPPPPPNPSLPPPRPVLEKTRVVAITYITQPNGQSCSSLSQEELRNITKTLCIQQIDYTTTLGWPRQQTDCLGTARCGGARQSAGASEHTTDLSLIHTPSQNQTAEEVATSLTQAMNTPQTFYAADFPPNTDITLSDSTIIPPGGSPAPSSPSPTPSPTPSSSPSPTPAPIFVPSPTPTPTPSGGGGGGSPSITAPGVPTSAVFTVNTGSVGTINAAWVAPAATGGAAVTYDILCTINTGTAPPLIPGVSATSYAITGLTPLATYACSVRATNSAGSSAYSTTVTGLAIPATVPDPPTIGAFTANTGAYGAANAAWSAPSSNGGAALTSYSIMCTPNTGPAVTATGISTSVCTGNVCSTGMTGLANTGTYTCKVLAVNSAGSSAYSGSSNSFDLFITPGAIWTQYTAVNTNTWWAIAYGAGYYAAVSQSGTGNRAMSSTDGISWSIQTSAADESWSSVTYGANQFVAVASTGTSAGQIMTSATGGSWTLRSHPASCALWSGIAYGAGVYVAVGGDGTDRVITSTDGISWTAVVAASQINWRAVTYGGTPGMFVAISNAGGFDQIMTSATGGSWTMRTTSAATQLNLRSITYGGGRYVAVNQGTGALTSTDGINWVYQGGLSNGNWFSVAYCGGTFTVVGVTTSTFMTSADGGVTWTSRDGGSSSNWRSITCGPDKFVAVAAAYVKVATSLV